MKDCRENFLIVSSSKENNPKLGDIITKWNNPKLGDIITKKNNPKLGEIETKKNNPKLGEIEKKYREESPELWPVCQKGDAGETDAKTREFLHK